MKYKDVITNLQGIKFAAADIRRKVNFKENKNKLRRSHGPAQGDGIPADNIYLNESSYVYF